MTKESVFGERPERVSNIILSGLLQVPVSFPGNSVWTEPIYFSSECAFLFSGDSWGICMFLGRDEGVFWAQDKNKMTHLSAFFLMLQGDFTIWIVCSEQGFFISYIIHDLLQWFQKDTQAESLLAPKPRIFSWWVLTMDVRALLRLHPKFAVGRYSVRC